MQLGAVAILFVLALCLGGALVMGIIGVIDETKNRKRIRKLERRDRFGSPGA